MVHVHKKNKMQNFERRTILLNTIDLRLPPAILSAPKREFAVPLRKWIRGNPFNEILNNIEHTMPFEVRGIISKISQMNQTGEKVIGNFICMLFILHKTIEDGIEQKS